MNGILEKRIFRKQHFTGDNRRVSEGVEEASGDGAEILSGGEALSSTLYAPTVIFNPAAHLKVSA